MLSDDFQYRFGGIQRLYGHRVTEAFSQAHVTVVGLGGVGSWAAEALARSGVGQITLYDLDEVCLSNTNRQLHALDGHYGRAKVEVMAERIRAINPACHVHPELRFVRPDNLEVTLTGSMDVVIDAIDSVNAKTALLAHCHRRKIGVICCGGAGGQIDPTQIRVGDLSRTTQDPLLAKVRQKLRREYGFSRNPQRRYGIESIYSTEQLTYPTPEGEVCLQKPATEGPVRLDCASGFGAATSVTATFGMFACARALSRIARQAQRQVSVQADIDRA